MDVSVIIVSWNVKDLLRRCLRSVLERTRGVDFDIWVVDNGSEDGSAAMVRDEFPQVKLLAGRENRGFAAANNAAIRESQGEFVLLLNPDTELREDAITGLVTYLRRHPQASVVGPRLAYPDGSWQRSVRRFPSLLSQVLIMLKLHHLWPGLKTLRRYFAEDIDGAVEAEVDQVMGAALMVRREALERLGGLDEDFFIWFEEVDLCRRVQADGGQVRYFPGVTVVHHGGESFAQVFGPDRQAMFNRSLRLYFRKHHGPFARSVLTALHPLSMALSWLVAAVRPRGRQRRPASRSAGRAQTFRTALLLLVLFEVFSLWGFIYPPFAAAGFLIVIALTVVLAVLSLELAALVLFAELFIGSQGGYLLSIGAGEGLDLSLRIGLFIVVFGAWAARTVAGLVSRDRTVRQSALGWWYRLRQARLLWPYLALLVLLAFGTVRGIIGGNDLGNIFFDANGYAYFALFPAVISVLAAPPWRERLLILLAAAVTVSVGKALLVFYLFSHRVSSVMLMIYTWIRDTRVGEITIMAGDFYRVFFQAHVFALVVAFILFLLLVRPAATGRRRTGLLHLAFIWSLTGLVMGLSRSFWFGGFVGVIAALVSLRWLSGSFRPWKRALTVGLVGLAAALLVITATYLIPFPRRGADVSFASLFGSRAFSLSGEAAANSRWALLPELWQAGWRHPVFGSGLGTTVTYTTSDPRLLALNPTGRYTTYAFEWGYHDLWVKFGILGLVIFAWFLAVVLAPYVFRLRLSRGRWSPDRVHESPSDMKKTAWVAGVLVGALALLATNVFSPYLNHPLGIGILMLVAAFGIYELPQGRGLSAGSGSLEPGSS